MVVKYAGATRPPNVTERVDDAAEEQACPCLVRVPKETELPVVAISI